MGVRRGVVGPTAGQRDRSGQRQRHEAVGADGGGLGSGLAQPLDFLGQPIAVVVAVLAGARNVLAVPPPLLDLLLGRHNGDLTGSPASSQVAVTV